MPLLRRKPVPFKWKQTEPPTTDMSAEELVARGYRRTSNAYGLISRIDRPDWVEYMAEKMGRAPADFYNRATGKVDGMWCDHYRAVYSMDTHIVDLKRIHRIPTSGFDPVGFIDVIDMPDSLPQLEGSGTL